MKNLKEIRKTLIAQLREAKSLEEEQLFKSQIDDVEEEMSK